MQKQYQIQSVQNVEGLHYVPKAISKEEQQNLVKFIYKSQWNTSLKRRTQHYGYEYSYLMKNTVQKADPIPDWALNLKSIIEGIVNQINHKGDPVNKKGNICFDQMIVNQYEPGQGISPHIDNTELFGDTVVSLSLASSTVMFFEKNYQSTSKQYEGGEIGNNPSKKIKPLQEVQQVALKRRSLVILQGPARFEWKHSIPARKKDYGVLRNTRVSITFRTMLKPLAFD